MKNRLFILAALAFILSSCATSGKYASNSFEDPIYSRSRSNTYIVVNKESKERDNLEELREKTKQNDRVVVDGQVVEAVYADKQGNVDIDARPGKTYIVLEEGESFEERLTKFDSPTYTINIDYNNFGYDDPWFWAAYHNPFYPYYRHDPYYRYGYRYPYYGDPFYMYRYADPFYMSWGWPYCRRYTNDNRVYASSSGSSARSSGSYTRRDNSRIEQVRGVQPYRSSTPQSSSALSGSDLRRGSSRYSRSSSERSISQRRNTSATAVRESARTISRNSAPTYRRESGTRSYQNPFRPSQNSSATRSSEQRSTSTYRRSSGSERSYSPPTRNSNTRSSTVRSSTTRSSTTRSSAGSSSGTSRSSSSRSSSSSGSRYRR